MDRTDIEAKEREASGITTLKSDYNRKDGYYFHVTNSNLSLVFLTISSARLP